MKLLVKYEFHDYKVNIHDMDIIIIPCSPQIIINEDAIHSIESYIKGLIGIKYGYFVLGEPQLKEVRLLTCDRFEICANGAIDIAVDYSKDKTFMCDDDDINERP